MSKKPHVSVIHAWVPVRIEDAHRAGIPQKELKGLDLDTFELHKAKRIAQPVYEILLSDIWVEQPLSDDWVAAFRLVPQGGLPIVAELRIFPRESTSHRRAGDWSGNLHGVKARVPAGGLTARVARMARVGITGDVIQQFTEKLREVGERAFGKVLGEKGFSREAPVKAKRATTLGRPDNFYAQIARDYEKLSRAGIRNLNQKIAERIRVSPEKVRDMIYQARKRGLLGPPPSQGKRGGVLTDKGREVLRHATRKGK